jgi:hypothetical protein
MLCFTDKLPFAGRHNTKAYETNTTNLQLICKLDMLFSYAYVFGFLVDGDLLPKQTGEFMYMDYLQNM